MSRINYKRIDQNFRWNLTSIPSFRKKFERDVEELNEIIVSEHRRPEELDPENRKLVLLLAELVVRYRQIIKECKQKALEEEVTKVTFKLYQKPGTSRIVLIINSFMVKEKTWCTNSVVLKEGFPSKDNPEKPIRFYYREIKVVKSHLVDQGKAFVRHLKNRRSKYTFKGKDKKYSFVLMRNQSKKLVVTMPGV